MARRSFSLSITVVVLLLIPVLFVFKISPSAAPVGAQEFGPKQGYVTGQPPTEAPLKSPNRIATNQAAKPAGKMGFVPASPSPNQRTTVARPESVANPVARRAVAQPPKVAVSPGAVPDAQGTQNPDTPSVVSRPARQQSQPRPSAVANKPPVQIPASRQFERPQPAVEPLEFPDETSEPVIATSRQQPTRTLQEPTLDETQVDKPEQEPPASEKRPGKGVVQLFFDDEPVEGESDESMDLDKPVIATTKHSGIRPVAAQAEPTQAQYTNNTEDRRKTRQEELADTLEDLKPVRQIDIRNAVIPPEVEEKKKKKQFAPNKFTELAMQLPDPKKFTVGEKLSETETKVNNEILRNPDDSAREMLRERKKFNVYAIARNPWQANRDSHPFYHNPLWFEDPNLERCGRGWGPLTTTVSAMHFAANIPILPYRFTAEKPWSCVRSLPDCTSCEKFGYEAYLPPWSLSAAAVQAAATVGFFYAIP